MKILHIKIGAFTYPIYIGEDEVQGALLEYCQSRTERFVIITDSNLAESLGLTLQLFLQRHQVSVELLSMPAGEKYKNRETKQQLEDTLLQKKYGKDTCLIALGGGVVTDLVGFLAATYCRGIPVVYVPTTLLAMVDASIGGKTGVDTPFGKNLIGAFYQPQAVFMNLQSLATLPIHEWRNGLVEMLKHAIIDDAEFFTTLQNNVHKFTQLSVLQEMIYKSCCIKKRIVEQDEKDLGPRNRLNFGHTIGHAIELIENYQKGHGEAVAIGMLVEAYLATLCAELDPSVVAVLEQVLSAYNLSLNTVAFRDLEKLKSILGMDKKSTKNIPRFVLLKSLGETYAHQAQHVFSVHPDLLDQALIWYISLQNKLQSKRLTGD